MPLNPRRILTRAGKQHFLTSLGEITVNGPLQGISAFAVSAVEVEALTDNITDRTLSQAGLSTAIVLGTWAEATSSASGKVQRHTEPAAMTASVPTGTASVIGFILGPDNVAANALAFLELDNPLSFDEDGEVTYISFEIGFDSQAFYLAPRVMPIGE